MPFVSDEQRKAAFARMRGSKGGRRPPRPPKPLPIHPGLQDVIDWMLSSNPSLPWSPLPNGPGIPGTPGGPVTLTGGAIYDTPGSSWFLNPDEPPPPGFGSYDGPGIGPYEQEFTPGWIPPETLTGQLYTIWVLGLDVYSGQPAPMLPWDPGYTGILEEKFSWNPGGKDERGYEIQPHTPGNPWYPFKD